MGDQGTVWLPEPGSTFAGDVDGLFYFTYWVSVVIFVLVVAAMAYFVYKYRRRSAMERPEPVHESKLLEATWIVVPTILTLIVFTWGFRVYLKLGVAPPDAYEIQVVGQKWAWQFNYPNGVRSAELHVPVDRPVQLKMSSVDVIHSFFVPAFRVKQDVLPNRYSRLWFEATRVDTFQVFCTEYCGTEHSSMGAMVIVHEQGDFEDWLKNAGVDPNAPPAERGEILYSQLGCQTCHSVDGSRKVGPTFAGLYGKSHVMADGEQIVADDNYLRESILMPGAKVVEGYPNVMPASYTNLTEDELTALIAYIEELQ